MFEEIAPKRPGAFRSVFFVVLCGFLALSLPGWLPALFDYPYVKAVYEFLVFLGIGLLIFFFLRSYATEYKYTLMDSVFVIRSKIGGREAVVAEQSLTEETRLIPLSQASELIEERNLRKNRISFGVSDEKSAYLLLTPSQEGDFAVIFQPSDKFVEILKQLVLDKSEKI